MHTRRYRIQQPDGMRSVKELDQSALDTAENKMTTVCAQHQQMPTKNHLNGVIFVFGKLLSVSFSKKKKRQNKLKNGIELHSKKAIAFRLVVSHVVKI